MTDGVKRPAHLQLARELGVAIVCGRRPPGSTLPSEIEMADRMQVARSVVREALRTLAAKGLVRSKPKTGTRVRERAEWNLLDPELLAWMFDDIPPASFVRSLYQLRLIVEPAAAALAATSRTPHQLARMGSHLEEMASHGLASERGRMADQSFHAVLLEATHNELLVSLSASIAAAVRWTTYFKFRAHGEPRDPIEEHRSLFDAIARADTEAARQATETLVRQAERDTEAAMLAHADARPEPPGAR